MNKICVGIDNGVTGSIGIVNQDGKLLHFGTIPTFSSLNYQKTKAQNITRIDTIKLCSLLGPYTVDAKGSDCTSDLRVIIERPMVNPERFLATTSALRALEAVLITVESLNISYQYCDSKAWQKVMLPKCDWTELKKVSRDVGIRLFPEAQGKHPDCDGLLIAEWARRCNL